MKKLWCSCILFVLLFAACGTSKKESVENNVVYFNNTYCNLKLTDEICPFMFNYAYCGEKPIMGGMVAIAENGEEFPVEVEEFEILNLENGYTIVRGSCYMDISNLELGTQTKIQDLLVKMNEEDVRIPLKQMYHIERAEFADNAPVYWTNIPGVMFENGSFYKEYKFCYTTQEDVVITGFEFLDFITVTEAEVFVNEVSLGNMREVFPLELKAGEELKIQALGDFSEYGNIDIVTNIILSYQYEGKETECRAVIKNYVIKNKDIGLILLKENGIDIEGEGTE